MNSILSSYNWSSAPASSSAADAAAGICPGERWGAWPSPTGLTLGILSVLVAQVLVIAYHWLRLNKCETTRVQPEPRPYSFAEGVRSHLGNPGGVLMMVAYLVGTWMFDIMPCSYYRFDGGVRPWIVFAQIACQDFWMYVMHLVEHKGLGAEFYKRSHKPHHRFTNPRLFDAFDGSVTDTFTMILVPLVLVARMLPANVWEYMAFGASWSSWLALIHSETAHPWDRAFRALGLGTAADHHVHHKTFVYNYGHTMMWWDWAFGTYKAPEDVRSFNKGV